jgi:hypothetical protein
MIAARSNAIPRNTTHVDGEELEARSRLGVTSDVDVTGIRLGRIA